MANVCYNRVAVRGPQAAVERFVAHVREPLAARIGQPATDEGDPLAPCPASSHAPLSHLDLGRLKPLPAGVARSDSSGAFPRPSEPGYWGTDRNVCAPPPAIRRCACGRAEATYAFASAWAPPLAALRHGGILFPELEVAVAWVELGAGVIGYLRGQGAQTEVREATEAELVAFVRRWEEGGCLRYEDVEFALPWLMERAWAIDLSGVAEQKGVSR